MTALSADILESIDFPYFQGLFDSLMGKSCNTALLDNEGNVLLTHEDGEEYKLEKNLPSMKKEIQAIINAKGNDSFRHIHYQDSVFLCMVPFGNENFFPCGWFASLHPDSQEDISGHIKKNLKIVADGIGRETRLQNELYDLTSELANRYDELQIFYDLKEILQNCHQGEETYQKILKLCFRCFDVDLALFFIPDADQAQYIQRKGLTISNLDLFITKLRSDVFRFVSTSKNTLVMNSLNDKRRSFLCVGMPFKLLAAPIQAGGEKNLVKGLIALAREKEKSDFSTSDRRLLDVLAEQAAILMKNQEMYSDLQLFTEQMANALIRAVDAKDPYTHGHSIRVNQYSMEIGRALKISSADLRSLYWSSLLHDLGKLGVPDIVLGKLGKLNDDEHTLIKIHPERGYDILHDVERLKPALPGIRHHHERFDGEGYPQGLLGKSIPLQSRIIAVADTFDAITTSRSYRSACPSDKAMEEIVRIAGSQLDPDLVAVWEKILTRNPNIVSNCIRIAEAINE